MKTSIGRCLFKRDTGALAPLALPFLCQRERETDRERQTERETDRERETERDRAGVNIIMSYVFPENFIETPQVVQKIRRFSSSIASTILIHFSDFLTFPCYKETNDLRM